MTEILASVSASLLFLALPAPTAKPPQANAAVRPIDSLTQQQRLSLPDDTKVSFETLVTTLGALRAAHQARSMRVASAAGAAQAAIVAVEASKEEGSGTNGDEHKPSGKPLIEPASEFADNALEMQKFCAAAQAAVCLYYPPTTALYRSGDWTAEIDPFITDESVCRSQGGNHIMQGCKYNYDASYHVQFNPRSGFTYKVSCNPQYWKVTKVDHHGAILVDSVIASGVAFTTGGSPASCIVRAWISP